jgi:hypothetical protein
MPLVVIQSVARLDEDALAAIPEAGREATLKERIAAATAAEDYAGARRWIDAYRAVCATPDGEVAVDEARAALASGNQARARFALEEYFATQPRSDPTYDAAAALYRSAVPEQDSARPGDAEPSSTQGIGDCRPPAAPEIPDGASASTEQMVEGQTHVKSFVREGQTYIGCVDAVADDKARATTDRNAAVGEHNRMVGELERAAADFNDQLRAFKARK